MSDRTSADMGNGQARRPEVKLYVDKYGVSMSPPAMNVLRTTLRVGPSGTIDGLGLLFLEPLSAPASPDASLESPHPDKARLNACKSMPEVAIEAGITLRIDGNGAIAGLEAPVATVDLNRFASAMRRASKERRETASPARRVGRPLQCSSVFALGLALGFLAGRLVGGLK